jgi:hypothetical protein
VARKSLTGARDPWLVWIILALVFVSAWLILARNDANLFCYDQGASSPHRLGFDPGNDHRCSQWELWLSDL